jgi:hypothetical protein
MLIFAMLMALFLPEGNLLGEPNQIKSAYLLVMRLATMVIPSYKYKHCTPNASVVPWIPWIRIQHFTLIRIRIRNPAEQLL